MNLRLLDEKIADIERQLTNLKMLRDLLEDSGSRQLIEEVLANGSSRPTTIPKGGLKPVRRGGLIPRLRKFFEDRQNEWATLKDLVDAGFSASSVRQIIYGQYPGAFDRMSYTGGGKPSRFRRKAGPVAVHVTLDASDNEVKREEVPLKKSRPGGMVP